MSCRPNVNPFREPIAGYSGYRPGIYAENLYAASTGDLSRIWSSSTLSEKRIQTANTMASRKGTPFANDQVAASLLEPVKIVNTVKPANSIPRKPFGRELQPLNTFSASSTSLTNAWPKQQGPLRALATSNGVDFASPEMRRRSAVNPGPYRIPGYKGFVPGVHAENVISGGYSRVVSEAEQVRARQQTSAGSSMRSSKSLPYLWT